MRYATVLLRFALLSLLVTAVMAPGARGDTSPPGGGIDTVRKIDDFLAHSGYSYRKIAAQGWLIKRQGKNIPDMNILVGAATNLIVVGVVVAPKDQVKITADSMSKMLRLANDLDFVKVGIDNDGDLFVRSELKTEKLDLPDFKSAVESVVTSADEAYAAIRPYLTVP